MFHNPSLHNPYWITIGVRLAGGVDPMHKLALAKTADPQEALEAAQVRDLVARIILDEYVGDLGGGELWQRPARRAADRIIEAIGGATARLSGEGAGPSERASRP
jgi:hypothetical protein